MIEYLLFPGFSDIEQPVYLEQVIINCPQEHTPVEWIKDICTSSDLVLIRINYLGDNFFELIEKFNQLKLAEYFQDKEKIPIERLLFVIYNNKKADDFYFACSLKKCQHELINKRWIFNHSLPNFAELSQLRQKSPNCRLP